MYYVIKRQYHAPMQRFIGFIVSKYIASGNTEHIIFEFTKDSKVQRKWVKKSEIVLLTQDKEHFIELLNHFKSLESAQQELVNEAQENLEKSIETFTITMDNEIDIYTKTKHPKDIMSTLTNATNK